jgi:hypothetical protein
MRENGCKAKGETEAGKNPTVQGARGTDNEIAEAERSSVNGQYHDPRLKVPKWSKVFDIDLTAISKGV